MKKEFKIAMYILWDILLMFASYLISALLFKYPMQEFLSQSIIHLIIGVAVVVSFNVALKLYSGLWKYVGFTEAVKLCCSALVSLVYNLVIDLFLLENTGIEWAIISTVFIFMCMVGVRFLPRAVYVLNNYLIQRTKVKGQKRVLIVGAGTTGASLIREMRSNTEANLYPVCAIDDDNSKVGRFVSGIKVVGKTNEIAFFVKKYGIDQIIVAMPKADKGTIKRVIVDCKKLNVEVKTVSNLLKFNEGQATVSDIKDVSIDDLLGREQIKVNLDDILYYIEGKTVLVTGGGGSIGSELCRQIATHNPAKLIILDIYENNAYDIQQELLRNVPNLNLLTLIASVRDRVKIEDVFKKYRPQIVFHAAAHKHVPLMETSPNEAVKNNVGGTRNVAEMAGKYNVQRFILISTDKAVNPTNVMGATKRICEMIIQTMNKKYDTEYVAVRFGNVLGSNGSVIPLFKKQIQEGGPVTVTHKDIVRYFMTIPEAVSLVLQAGAYAKGGEIFVLDMGEPVKIYDLAENLIRLSGLTPNVDIDIKITGLRAGEKLYEERLMEEEGLQRTENKMISIGKPLNIDEQKLYEYLDILSEQAYNETDKMKELVKELVPTYKPDLRE
ncbi:MAG: polysaccharide biosynthesis protein [Clostridiales bacterium]|nr:polysaccharide biosynthesis protein [Clostridiales bacterium]